MKCESVEVQGSRVKRNEVFVSKEGGGEEGKQERERKGTEGRGASDSGFVGEAASLHMHRCYLGSSKAKGGTKKGGKARESEKREKCLGQMSTQW